MMTSEKAAGLKLPEGEDLRRMVALLNLLGTPKQTQDFILYFFGRKLGLSFISGCKYPDSLIKGR